MTSLRRIRNITENIELIIILGKILLQAFPRIVFIYLKSVTFFLYNCFNVVNVQMIGNRFALRINYQINSYKNTLLKGGRCGKAIATKAIHTISKRNISISVFSL